MEKFTRRAAHEHVKVRPEASRRLSSCMFHCVIPVYGHREENLGRDVALDTVRSKYPGIKGNYNALRISIIDDSCASRTNEMYGPDKDRCGTAVVSDSNQTIMNVGKIGATMRMLNNY